MERQTATKTKSESITSSPLSRGILQRKCACGNKNVGGGECAECGNKKQMLQRCAANQNEPTEVPPIVHEVLRSPGQPLDAETRAFMEPRFGHDFSQVRVHTDVKAAESAKAVNALAYTVGRNVVFGEGHHIPGITKSKHLLAHELVHVIQQNVTEYSPRKLVIDKSGNPYDQQAEQIANQVVSNTLFSNHQSTPQPSLIKQPINQGSPIPIMRVPDEDGIKDTPPHYSYSKNCGWIDWGHALPQHAEKLINQVREASSRIAASPGSQTEEEVVGPRMEAKKMGILFSGVTPIAHIRRSLSGDEVLSVALRIFMLQSLGFESMQERTEWIGKSSFSEEDLPSNIIGFYRSARGFDRPKIEKLCDLWSVTDALNKYQGYKFSKNSSFRPLSLPLEGSWPTALSDIQPAEAGGALVDVPEGKFESSLDRTERKSLGSFIGFEVINSGQLHIEPIGVNSPIDISNEGTDPDTAPHFEVRSLPAQHNLQFRWSIRDKQDNSYQMWGKDGRVFQYGPQYNAYIGSRTRALLKSRGVKDATINCRVIAGYGHVGQIDRLLTLPVTFTW